MNELDHKESKSHLPHKQTKHLQGKRINHQVVCPPQPQKQKIRVEMQLNGQPQQEMFKDLLSKRDRHKESQSKLEHRPVKRLQEESNFDKQNTKKQNSKSRSKSKGIVKSKSMKQLVKKSKSMVRLQGTKNLQREERKSESPQPHVKSVISYVDRKQFKSNFNSKTTRQMVSQQNTEREKSKSRLKIQKTSKKPQKPETIKKNITNKSTKTKSQKENKTQKRSKRSKNKKEKKVLISQENSKIKREGQFWQQSLNEDDFLDSKHKQGKYKTHNKDINIVNIPKRKQRLSFNTIPSRKPTIKHKTQAQVESHHSQKRELENQAAVVIQKIFRGYLTRKYIKECLFHNAAITIQKNWRGYLARKIYHQRKGIFVSSSLKSSPKRIANQKSKILERQEYLMQKSLQKSQLKSSSMINQKWASILQQILSEQSVNFNIKRKIQNFLQSQRKELHQFNIVQTRSPSANSSISSQVITNEINSERHFFEQERIKKEKYNEQFTLNSPHYISPKRFQYSSPQNMLGSPQSRIANQSPTKPSSQLLVGNLKNIQKLHIDRLKNKAINQKQQLNKMLIKNKLSPRTHQKKYKEVQFNLESQLQKFNQSINEVVKNCIIYAQPQQTIEHALITPKKQFAEVQQSGEQSPRQQQLGRPQQMSIQFRQYYETQKSKEEVKDLQKCQAFDTSYQFIQEYLINLIEFLRQSDNGSYISKAITVVLKPRSRDIDMIFKNLKTFTQGSEEEENQNSFRMPIYKYIDLQEEIIDPYLAAQFNSTFTKIQQPGQLDLKNALQQSFLKMIVDCMNQALNALRPQEYPFVQTKLSSVNSLKSLKKISLLQYQGPEEEMHYQFICAQALDKIFYWNRQQWGKIIRYQDQPEVNQAKIFLMKQQEAVIVQQEGHEDWPCFQQMIEIIGAITQETFQIIIFEEIAAVWSAIMQWSEKIGKNSIKIEPPNSKKFYQH